MISGKFPAYYLQLWTVIIVLVMAVSSCASESATPIPAPTQSLIVFTPSPTSLPLTPTSTSIPPPSAGDLLLTPRSADSVSVVEEQIIGATENDLAARLELDSTSQLQLVLYEAVHWEGDELECESDPLRLTTQGMAGYRIVYLYNDTVYIYRTTDSEYSLCVEANALEAPPDVIVQIDPVAADIVSLAQRRIADDLDISTRRVNVQSLEVRVWDDASLGCPAAGQNYDPIETNGYRLVLTAGENGYIFHASFDRLILCQDEPLELSEDEN